MKHVPYGNELPVIPTMTHDDLITVITTCTVEATASLGNIFLRHREPFFSNVTLPEHQAACNIETRTQSEIQTLRDRLKVGAGLAYFIRRHLGEPKAPTPPILTPSLIPVINQQVDHFVKVEEMSIAETLMDTYCLDEEMVCVFKRVGIDGSSETEVFTQLGAGLLVLYLDEAEAIRSGASTN